MGNGLVAAGAGVLCTTDLNLVARRDVFVEDGLVGEGNVLRHAAYL
jgi:hypothetical protein